MHTGLPPPGRAAGRASEHGSATGDGALGRSPARVPAGRAPSGECPAVLATSGLPAAGVVALCIGLFNSIMFPVIFTLTLERSSAPTPATSGLLCMSIVGGAFLPLAAGRAADQIGLHSAFFVPLAAYVGG